MKLASIERITDIRPHLGADKLELGKVLEWPVVVKKGQYKDGDKVIYIFPDTVAPSDNPYFDFLAPRKHRVNKIRLRKEISCGIVCKLSDMGHLEKTFDAMEIGTEVSELLGIKKFEKPIDASINGEAKGTFPVSIISQTDEDNFLSNKGCEKEFLRLDCVASVKCDGSSGTFIYLNDNVMVCSRRQELKEGDNAWWNVVRKYDLVNKAKILNYNFSIQFEVCGPKMNGNKLQLSELDMFVFNVKNLDTDKWEGINGIKQVCNILGLKMPPIISEFNYDGVNWNLEKLRQIANAITYPAGNPGEGIVIRPIVPVFSSILGKSLSVKIISENYED